MKPKKSSPTESELGIMDFVPSTKPEKGITGIIEESGPDVKKGVESAFTVFGKMMSESLSSIARLQREAKKGRDG